MTGKQNEKKTEKTEKVSNNNFYTGGFYNIGRFCDHKPLLDGLLFCGSKAEAEEYYRKNQDVKLWVSLNENPQKNLPFDSENKLFAQRARIIYYPIEDRGVPVYEGFSSLIDLILEYLNNKKKVIINCFGGHGRTGLVLCCVMGKLKPEISDIIKYCRDIYCKQIIESLKQAEFVFKFLNKKLPQKYVEEFDISWPPKTKQTFFLTEKDKKQKEDTISENEQDDEYFPYLNCGICGRRGNLKYEPSLQMYLCRKCRRRYYATGKI